MCIHVFVLYVYEIIFVAENAGAISTFCWLDLDSKSVCLSVQTVLIV